MSIAVCASTTVTWRCSQRAKGKAWRWAVLRTASTTLAHGRLVLPFRKVIALDLHYHLLVPETRVDEPLIAAFRAWLTLEAEDFRSVLSRHGAMAQAA
jgi:LysR family glycine cleavage system transcriptional activator